VKATVWVLNATNLLSKKVGAQSKLTISRVTYFHFVN